MYKTFKGTAGEYNSLHHWVRYHLGKPNYCEHCGSTDRKRYEWANISKQYKKDTSDWKRLCKPCHNKFDAERDYWRDEYCGHGHRLTVDNLYLRKDHRKFKVICLECRRCREDQRIKYRLKLKEATL